MSECLNGCLQMIDFANLTAYTNYKTCDDKFVKKAFIGR